MFDGPQCKISLLLHPEGAKPLRVGEVLLEPGGAILWYLFPGRSYEVAGVYDAAGRFRGWYTNLLRPPEIRQDTWELTDLYLDVWQPPDGEARLLDQADLEAALATGAIAPDEARRVQAEAEAVLRASRAGRWPPKIVRRYPLDAVGSLRLLRDAPGTWHANRAISRLIGFGMYAFGATSLTSLVFAAFTDAFAGAGPAQSAWIATIAAETAVLLVLALLGRLPATLRPRPEEAVNERILFIGSVVAALAVFLYPDGRLWRSALVAIYASLALFLGIFAVSRVRWDHRIPRLALAGLAVCAFALFVLLA